MDQVFKLHGLPWSITSDRDLIFLSMIWSKLFQIQGVSLNKSTAYLQSNDQTEIVNNCLETCLRCKCSNKPSSWSKWLVLAEWWYNTNFHSSIQTTPYEVDYGQASLIHLSYLPRETTNFTVECILNAREDFHLLCAQNLMSQHADKHCSDPNLEIHNVFHVPQSKLNLVPHIIYHNWLNLLLQKVKQAILDKKIVKRGHITATK
ncbi:Tf2-11, partial [Mucuna pruriens]